MITRAERIEEVMSFLKTSSDYATKMLEQLALKETPEEGFESFKAMVPESKTYFGDALEAVDYTTKETFLTTVTEALGEAAGISLIKGLTLAWTITGDEDVDEEVISSEFYTIMNTSLGLTSLMECLKDCRDNDLPLINGINNYSESEDSEQIIVESSISFLTKIAESEELFNPNDFLDYVSRNIILASVINIYDYASEGVAE